MPIYTKDGLEIEIDNATIERAYIQSGWLVKQDQKKVERKSPQKKVAKTTE